MLITQEPLPLNLTMNSAAAAAFDFKQDKNKPLAKGRVPKRTILLALEFQKRFENPSEALNKFAYKVRKEQKKARKGPLIVNHEQRDLVFVSALVEVFESLEKNKVKFPVARTLATVAHANLHGVESVSRNRSAKAKQSGDKVAEQDVDDSQWQVLPLVESPPSSPRREAPVAEDAEPMVEDDDDVVILENNEEKEDLDAPAPVFENADADANSDIQMIEALPLASDESDDDDDDLGAVSPFFSPSSSSSSSSSREEDQGEEQEQEIVWVPLAIGGGEVAASEQQQLSQEAAVVEALARPEAAAVVEEVPLPEKPEDSCIAAEAPKAPTLAQPEAAAVVDEAPEPEKPKAKKAPRALDFERIPRVTRSQRNKAGGRS